MTSSKFRPDPCKLLLATIFLILSFSTVAWTLADRTPPPWDPSDHMITAYDYYRSLAHADLAGLAKDLFGALHFYAPVVHLLTAAFFLIFGASRLSGVAVNLLSLAVLMFSVFWMGRRLYSASGAYLGQPGPGAGAAGADALMPGVLAALLAACYHFPAWLLHDAFLDYPLTAIVAASFALLIRAGDFQSRPDALRFGIAAGLGMLTKQTFAFFFVLPAAYVTVSAVFRRDRRALVNLALSAAAAVAIAAVWYGPHLKDVVEIYRANQQAALDENEAPLFSFMSNVVYLHGLLSYQIQGLFGLLFLCGLTYSLARRRKESVILCLWVLSGLLCFTLVANKDMRYTVPVLPAVALLSVSWLGNKKDKPAGIESSPPTERLGVRLKRVAVAASVMWAFVSFFNAQWPRACSYGGYYIDTPRFRWMVLGHNYFAFDHRPLRDDWGVPEALGVISQLEAAGNDRAERAEQNPDSPGGSPAARRVPAVLSENPADRIESGAGGRRRATLGVVVNLPYLNPSSVALYARLMSPGRAGPPLVDVIWLVSAPARSRIHEADYLLVRTGLDRAEWVAPLEKEVEDLIRANPAEFTRVAGFPIPLDGAEAVVYKQGGPRPAHGSITRSGA